MHATRGRRGSGHFVGEPGARRADFGCRTRQRLYLRLGHAADRSADRHLRARIERCLRNLQHILETAGSSLDRICMVHVYASGDHYRTINEVYARFFPADPPARTFVPVGDWPLEFDIEIECVALA